MKTLSAAVHCGCVGAVLILCAGLEAGAQGNGPPVAEGPPEFVPATVYIGDTVHFTVKATDPDGDLLTYAWNFGDNSTPIPAGSANQVSHAFAAAGRYAVIARIRDSLHAVTASVIVAVHHRSPPLRPTSSSSIILDTARNRVYCVNPDNHSVSAVDGIRLEFLWEIPTGLNPQTLALAPDGNIWVANKGSATVTVLNPAGTVVNAIALAYGSAPHGLVFSPDGLQVYATLEGAGKLIELDPVTRRVTDELTLGSTPRGIAVPPDGKRILITRFISPADHAEVWEVDAATFAKVRTFELAEDLSPDDETGGAGVLNYLQSVVISPTGREAVIPAKKDNIRRGLSRNGLPLIFENTVRTVSTRLNLLTHAEDPALRNDIDNASLATAAAFSPLGDLFFVALQGINAVHVLDPYNNGAVLERIADVGPAPRGLALDGKAGRLYVHNFLGRSVAVFDIATVLANSKYESKPVKTVVTVTREALSPEVLRGKRLFYNAADSNMSRDGYISCAVCHLDGGSDGRIWDFTDRGEGLRRTTSLVGRAGIGHGPVHWSANFDEIQDFEHDMRGPFGGRGFMDSATFFSGNRNQTLGGKKTGLSPDLDALAAYVASLERVNPSPFRNADGSPTEDARAGEGIFNRPEVGCAKCHVPPRYTDSELLPTDFSYGIQVLPGNFRVHDVGTLKPASGRRLNDTLKGLDTPTLLGIWETGPYLHDGSAATVIDVIGAANAGDRHGRTSQLTPREKEQLAAFLLQLDQGALPAGTRPGGHPIPPRRAMLRAFTGAGMVRIALSGWGEARPRLTLWDGKGRAVKIFRSEEIRRESSGSWTAIWQGRDSRGLTSPRGLYLLRASAGSLSATATLPWLP